MFEKVKISMLYKWAQEGKKKKKKIEWAHFLTSWASVH